MLLQRSDAMIKQVSGEETAHFAPELDEIAAELYGLHPDAFAPARDEQVRRARGEGRQPLARELSRLRRPTQSAWLINLLWREQREVMEQFLQLGEELSRAQAEASGPELHRLSALRRELEAALIRTARGLAQKAGSNVSASMEREAQETLSAALAQPEVAAEVRTGRLVKPAAYAGFGTLMPSVPAASAQQPARDDRKPTTSASKATSARGTLDAREARVAQRARERREAAERGVEEARAALEASARALATERDAAQAAQQRHETLGQQVEQLEQQLRELKDHLSAAQTDAAAAARQTHQAEKIHETALRALARAEQELREAGKTEV